MLQENFFNAVLRYASPEVTSTFWNEITTSYSSKKRHYHNLTHLEHLFQQLHALQSKIQDWDTVVLSICYHDIIYKVSRKDNEEQSAVLARKRLESINYPSSKTALCEAQVLATKSHQLHTNNDVNLFTDADLSILGANNDTYRQYAANIRKEYARYPDFLYNSGRKKVLQHFLAMVSIFKTIEFQQLYEAKARENLLHELETL